MDGIGRISWTNSNREIGGKLFKREINQLNYMTYMGGKIEGISVSSVYWVYL